MITKSVTLNPAIIYQNVQAAKQYTVALKGAFESGERYTLQVGSRVYRVQDNNIEYYSQSGKGRYYIPSSWKSVYNYILEAIQHGENIEERRL